MFLKLYNEMGINSCGTVQTNRKGFPKSIVKKKKEDRGYYDYQSNGALLACAWYDRRSVYFLSTLHCGESASGMTTVSQKMLTDLDHKWSVHHYFLIISKTYGEWIGEIK